MCKDTGTNGLNFIQLKFIIIYNHENTAKIHSGNQFNYSKLFLSGQSKTNVKQILSNPDTRKGIMDNIANDSIMSKEMMGAMMNNKNCKMMMQGNEKMTMMTENHEKMMKMMKDNPGMMNSMMTDMMEACKSDTSMMSSMCKAMMENKQMKDMMQKKMGGNIDKKKNGWNEQIEEKLTPDHLKLVFRASNFRNIYSIYNCIGID